MKGAVFLSEFADQVSEAGRELDSPTPFEAGTPPEVPPVEEDY